jgi:4-amino-4-deoxy-L-arabinose transferase-like glycosyltransferase
MLVRAETPPRPSFTGWIVVSSLVLGLGTLAYPRTAMDTPIFTYVGWVILQGGQPYVDVWDIKAPATHLLYGLGLLLFGKSVFGIRLLDLLWQTATALAVARLAWVIHRRNSTASVAGLLYLVLYFSNGYWNLAQADGFLSLPLALGFLCLARAIEEDHEIQWLQAGMGVGAAVFFKLPLGLCAVAMIGAALARRSSGNGRVYARLAALAAGFALPVAAVMTYLFLGGGLRDFLYSQFVFAPQYTAFLRAHMPARCVRRAVLAADLVPQYFLAVMTLVPPVSSLVRRERIPLPAVMMLTWLAVAALTVVVHGHYLRYHFLPLLAPLAVLGAGWLHHEYASWRTSRSALSALLLAIIVVALAFTARRIPQHYRFELGVVRHGRARDTFDALGLKMRALTVPHDRIYVWGNAPGIYFHAERRAASRFFYALYLYTPDRHTAYRSVFLSELHRNKPRYILVLKYPDRYPGCAAHATPSRALMEFDELRELIHAEYGLEEETPGILLYHRNDDVSPAVGHSL